MKPFSFLIIFILLTIKLTAQVTKTETINDTLLVKSSLQFSDDFDKDLLSWNVQNEIAGGSVKFVNDKMEIIANRGCTIWFKRELTGPIMIEYDAVMIDNGGPLDRVSDLNCFFMASDPNDLSEEFINAGALNGSLGAYNKLKLYYVGLGGRKNTTTRFRRYPGTGERPMLPEHDLRDKKYMLTGNTVNHVKIIVYNNFIQYYRNNQLVFDFYDANPFTSGYFGFRTTINHMTVDNFKVYKLSKLNKDKN
ncbi:DUF6250 domain-containing protein [Seonamhaeicola sp. MEBiC1930]|uniref:DUF6250 domain-containing protein n=1 Tax=Seonamhaeicola sp. MEBiC01930 TaxID=2976768 RepID=UPI003248D819